MLKNKVVVITGSTKGLGRATACAFLSEGAKVIINSRDKKELEAVCKEMGVIGYAGNVTKEADMKKLVNFAVKKFGKLDVWVNNAGIWLPHLPIEQTDWKRAHDLIEVNLFGTVYGSKSALAQMRKQGFGTIVNIISTSGLDGKINETAYCSSKFAVRGFTEALMKEVDEKKIKVLGVYPGGMQTNLFDEKRPKKYKEFMEPSFVAQKIIQNLKLAKPKEKLVIRRK
ncbi:MAG: SDR family oxidoreductase [Candidatus Pacebacteria bacterium]|nr:SDR family oxidoreductase [Candidatus Paceibacterota bacterium]